MFIGNEETISKMSRGHCKQDYLDDQPVTYETAISLVGFGKYNYYFLFLCFPTILANLLATSSISYILTQAQCDLNLSLENKGMLNAITYIGMVSSGLFWGILGDNYGRRSVLIVSLALEGFCEILTSFSRHYWLILVAKYFSGFMICGSVVSILTYISEFHHHTFRPKLITIIGIYAGIAKIILPLLAWLLIPLHLDVIIIPGFIELKSWQLYILVSSAVSILASVIHYLLPESPKFLMTKGKYDTAMFIFTGIYHKNKGNVCKTLPFSRVIDVSFEKKQEVMNTEKSNQFWGEIKSLFSTPLCSKLLTVASINFGSLLGAITLRLWLPQLLTTMDVYYQTHNKSEEMVLCDILNYKINESDFNFTDTCTVPEISTETYLHYTVVPMSSIILYLIIGLTINYLGKKTILLILPFLGGLTILSNFFSKNSLTTVILSSIYLAFVSVNSIVCTSVSIELFPTNLRAKAVSFVVIFGRFGPLVGNVSFPFLLYSGCLTPFIFIASFAFLCTLLAFLLPNTERQPLV